MLSRFSVYVVGGWGDQWRNIMRLHPKKIQYGMESLPPRRDYFSVTVRDSQALLHRQYEGHHHRRGEETAIKK